MLVSGVPLVSAKRARHCPKWALAFFFAFLFLLPASAAELLVDPEEDPPRQPQSVPGEFLVRRRAEAPQVRLQGAASQWKLQPLRKPRAQNRLQGAGRANFLDQWFLVETPPTLNPAAVLQQLRENPSVLLAEPNYKVKLAQASEELPDDFEFARQWGLHNTGQDGGTNHADVHAVEAWKIARGSRSIKVAVIDTGIDFFHPDLRDNLWTNQQEIPGNGLDDDGNGYIDDFYGYDFVSNDRDPLDDNDHGTHVAGIIAASGNNQIGVAGVCWEASLMALKAFDEHGNADVAQVAESIGYAIENGAKVINASWSSDEESELLKAAVEEAHLAGALVVAAAGNSRNDSKVYPAAQENVLAVAATDRFDRRAIFSNHGSFVDLAAPGEFILSTLPNNRYGPQNGTSMATPFVVGAAALIWAQHPEFRQVDVSAILRNTVDELATPELMGSGRLNVHRAVLVDQPLAELRLDFPSLIRGVISVQGAVQGAFLKEYVLEYGKSFNPTNWVEFHRGAQTAEGLLFENFDTGALEEGPYTFRIRAWNQKGFSSIERARTTVQNVHMSVPGNNDVVRFGDRLPIRGTVFGRGKSYRIQYGTGGQPSVWQETAIHLAGEGMTNVVDGILGWWDTSQLRSNEFYTVRLRAEAAGQPPGEWTSPYVFLDGNLKEGWPKAIPFAGKVPEGDWMRTTAADLDGDGLQEIILLARSLSGQQPARLHVLTHQGKEFWTLNLGYGVPDGDSVAVGDLEGDGRKELFVDLPEQGLILGLDFLGDPIPGWPVSAPKADWGKTVADLDGDGTKELIVFAQKGEGWLIVLGKDGKERARWGMKTRPDFEKYDLPEAFAAVANLDEDPDLEIITVDGGSRLSMHELGVADKAVWAVELDGAFLAPPVIGDLNRDGKNEIVLAAYDPSNKGLGGLYVFDGSGALVPGWPVLTDESFGGPVALADFDGDDDLEIAAPSWSSRKLHLVHHHGFEAMGWPVGPVYESSIRAMPSAGDLDGDGAPDLVLASAGQHYHAVSSGDIGYFGGIKAWTAQGKPIDLNAHSSNTALIMESSGGYAAKGGPVILTDLEGNGRLDIVCSSISESSYFVSGMPGAAKKRSSVYVWELPHEFSSPTSPWPQFQRDSEQTGFAPRTLRPNKAPEWDLVPEQVVAKGASFYPIDLAAFSWDPEGEAVKWSILERGDLKAQIDDAGTLQVSAPNAEWLGSAAIRVRAQDPAGAFADVVIHFQAVVADLPPIAVEDSVRTDEDTPVELTPLLNDLLPKNASIVQISRVQNGTVSLMPADRVLFEPSPDFAGTENFYYLIRDEAGLTAFARVRVEVSPINDQPDPLLDRAICLEDGSAEIEPLRNDSDPDGDLLEIVEFTAPAKGTIELGANQTFLYTPTADYYGFDSFRYTVRDPAGLTAQAEVSVMVKRVKDAPVATDQTIVLNRNNFRDIFFQAVDPDNDELTYKIVDGPTNGVVWAYPKIVTYYPNTNFFGSDRFTYVANDGDFESAPAVVSISVSNENNPPTANNQNLVTKSGQKLSIALTGDDLDKEALTFTIVKMPEHGTLSGEGGAWIYEPELGYLGSDSFTFTAYDGHSASTPGMVYIKVTDVNTAPQAKDVSVQTKVNVPLTILLPVTDGEADPLTFEIVSGPSHGKLVGEGPQVVYHPNTNFVGPDRFWVRGSDAQSTSGLGSVSISVLPLNAPPNATNQIVQTEKDWPLTIGLAVWDGEGDGLVCPILKGPQHGRLIGLGTNLTYIPMAGFTGQDSFTYKPWDGVSYGNPAEVQVMVMPFLPSPEVRFAQIQPLANGTLLLQVDASGIRELQIEASSDWIEWSALTVTSSGSGKWEAIDTNGVAAAFRFYRASAR